MNLVDDFRMYYSDTWLGVKRGDKIHPFYINNITWDRDAFVGDHHRLEDVYGNGENISCIVFEGYEVTDEEGETSPLTLRKDSSELVLDPPILGYVKVGGVRWGWCSLVPSHTAKKGICSRKLSIGSVANSHSDIFRLFNTHPDDHEELINRDTLVRDGTLFYKGFKVGKVEGSIFYLLSEAMFLSTMLQKDVDGCQILELLNPDQ